MKKQFRLTAIFCAGIVLFLAGGCRKDDPQNTVAPPPPPQQYFTRFKIDGVEKQYTNANNTCRFNDFVAANNQYNTGISCYLDSDDLSRNGIGISLNDANAFVLNRTYVNFPTTNAAEYQVALGMLTYTDENGIMTSDMSVVTSPNLRVTLTEQTATYLKGRFSATLYSSANVAVHQLTDGEFYLPIFQ
ncbi:MAG: hypothetical protein MUC87_06920 [Bacteroidia bacterium]|jgi:hypothetical protein|nr:hypothetical protein [Bacteroidia bacterium]